MPEFSCLHATHRSWYSRFENTSLLRYDILFIGTKTQCLGSSRLLRIVGTFTSIYILSLPERLRTSSAASPRLPHVSHVTFPFKYTEFIFRIAGTFNINEFTSSLTAGSLKVFESSLSFILSWAETDLPRLLKLPPSHASTLRQLRTHSEPRSRSLFASCAKTSIGHQRECMKFQVKFKTCFEFLDTTIVLTELCDSNFLPFLQIELCLWLLAELNRGHQLLLLTCLTEEVISVCKDKLENVPEKRVKPHSSLRKIENVWNFRWNLTWVRGKREPRPTP